MAVKREQKQTESGMDKEKCKKFYVKFELMMCVVPSMFFELSSAKIGDGNLLKQTKKKENKNRGKLAADGDNRCQDT